LPNHRRRAREADGVPEAIRECARLGLKRKEALGRLRELFPEGLFSDKDVANELQKYRGLRGGESEVAEEQGEQEEEMEDVGEVEDENERELQVQLQAQNGQVQQDHQHQQMQQPMLLQRPQQQMQQPTQLQPLPQQPTQVQQPQQLHQQSQQHQQHQQSQQLQQHQHIFTPGVPAYWWGGPGYIDVYFAPSAWTTLNLCLLVKSTAFFELQSIASSV
jgi:hypothetical protein